MKKPLATMLAAFLVFGCTAMPQQEEALLLPPAGSTRETRMRDIIDSLAKAREAYASGEPVEDAQRARLQGRSTIKFFREGQPVVTKDGIPGQWNSSLVPMQGYAPKGISDRYILYLMDRGFQWPQAGQTSQSMAQPKG